MAGPLPQCSAPLCADPRLYSGQQQPSALPARPPGERLQQGAVFSSAQGAPSLSWPPISPSMAWLSLLLAPCAHIFQKSSPMAEVVAPSAPPSLARLTSGRRPAQRPSPPRLPHPSTQAAPFPAPSSVHSGEPLLAVLRDARRLFDKVRSKPCVAAALPFVLHSPCRLSSLSCSLRSPIRDAVETRGEKPPLPLLLLYFFVCSIKC
jgi:hypothetical protein|uniref:Uncharacterized protein n=1 Tax=Zea mays TaxID=4577 RepID=A0A804PSS2_MAIZE